MSSRVAIVCALCATVASCFRPTAPAGAPCAMTGDCPAPYTCSVANLCELACDQTQQVCGVPDGPRPPLDAAADAAADAAIDARLDAPGPADCWAKWGAGTQVLGTPRKLTALSTGQHEADPSLSADGLTLYFARSAAVSGHPWIAYRAKRASVLVDFANPTLATEVAPDGESVSKVTANADGSELIFVSDRPGSVGGTDLWRVRRVGNGFSQPSEATLGAIETTENELDAWLSRDGLHLYFSRTHGSPVTSQDLWVATRAAPDDAFSTGVQVAVQPAASFIADPVLSPDGLVLLGSSILNGQTGIYYAIRTSSSGPFQVRGVVMGSTSGDPELSADGCTLYYSGVDPDVGGSLRDLYVVDVH